MIIRFFPLVVLSIVALVVKNQTTLGQVVPDELVAELDVYAYGDDYGYEEFAGFEDGLSEEDVLYLNKLADEEQQRLQDLEQGDQSVTNPMEETAPDQPGRDVYTFAKHIKLNADNALSCEEQCYRSISCYRWVLLAANRTTFAEFEKPFLQDYGIQTEQPSSDPHSSHVHDLDCYLLTELMERVISLAPDVFWNKEWPMMQGVKIMSAPKLVEMGAFQDGDTVTLDSSSSASSSSSTPSPSALPSPLSIPANVTLSHVRTSHILKGPIPTDHTTLLNYPNHFVRGCAYSISIWVWLWRKKHPKPPYHEEVIISTREIYPNIAVDDVPLLPAIIFNVGEEKNRDKFFFSVERDQAGAYNGIWVDKRVRYHDWIHLTLTVNENNILYAYVDGEFVDYLVLEGPPGRKCPYGISSLKSTISPNSSSSSSVNEGATKQTSTHSSRIKTKTSTDEVPSSHNNNNNNNNNDNDNRNKNRTPYEEESKGIDSRHWHDFTNNTILSVAGARQIKSMVGMVKDVIVVQNAALTSSQIQHLMKSRPPPKMPTLTKLLKEYGIYPLATISILPFERSFYRMLEWGFCPDLVCGPICIADKFFFELPSSSISCTSSASSSDSTSSCSPSTPTSQSSLVAMSPSTTNITHESKHSSSHLPRAALLPSSQSLPDIGFTVPLGTKSKKTFKWILSFLEDLPLIGGFFVKPNLVLVDWLTVHGFIIEKHPPFNTSSTTTSKKTSSSSSSSSSSTTTTTASTTAASTTSHDKTASNSDKDETISRNLKGNIDPVEDRMVKSYRAWESGHRALEDWYTRSPLGKLQGLYKAAMMWLKGRHEDFASESSQSLQEWRAGAIEKSQAALYLALWLSDDMTTPLDTDVPWVFSYPPMLMQPIKLALAFRIGYDTQPDVPVTTSTSNLLNNSTVFKALGQPIHTYLSGPSSGLQDVEDTAPSFQLGSSRQSTIFLEDADKKDYTSTSAPPPSEPSTSSLSSSPSNDETNKMSAREKILTRRIKSTDWFHTFSSFDYLGVDIATLFYNLPAFEPLAAAGLNQSVLSEIVTQWHQSPQATAKEKLLKEEHHEAELRNYNKDHTHMSRHANVFTSLHEADPHVSKEFSSQVESIANSPDENDCYLASSLYFPTTQYVASHFGIVETGVSVMEDVRIMDNNLSGYGGETDEIHIHHENEAADGDPHAQVWLGKRYFWGWGGVQPNAVVAREWFERAAAQHDPEGMYNLGAFYANGQGGLERDPVRAHDLFMRAAHAQQPFNMALHALGNHYLYTEKNYTLAREYFEKAADLDSADGHFSLAVMLQPGGTDPRGKIDIPLSVVHLAEAASLGHVRAANFLAHGLFDSESWLRQYGREEELKRKKEATFDVLFPNRTKASVSAATYASSNLTRWKYNESQPLYIRLPTVLVQLPYPLGGAQTSCKASLAILKYLAEHSYRTNDLMRAGLQAYANKNLWEALEYYDEASELGVSGAQENAAFLYNEIMSRECPRPPSGNLLLPALTNDAGDPALSNSSSTSPFSSPLSLSSSYLSSSLSSTFSSSATSLSSSPLTKFHADINSTQCTHYMERMAARRWIQLANTGDFLARREIARRIAEGRGSWERNTTKAAILYAMAAEQGDVQSLMSLGWLLARGDGNHFPRNVTAAKSIFSAALRAEFSISSKDYWQNLSLSPYHTNGLAPLIALGILWIEETVTTLSSYFYLPRNNTHAEDVFTTTASSFVFEFPLSYTRFYTSFINLTLQVATWMHSQLTECLQDDMKAMSFLVGLFVVIFTVFMFRRRQRHQIVTNHITS